MLKRMLCQAEIGWELSCDGPLLIRDGRYESYGKAKDGYPQCLFLSHLGMDQLKKEARDCANKPPYLSFYVPGTSLRGPFRAQAERIIRTLCPEENSAPKTACDPFQDNNEDGPLYCCSKHLEKIEDERPPYARVCPACRIFGCTGLASRILFTDADIADGYHSVYRDMIGIDRFTGGVSQNANMKLHALEDTIFASVITITNYELWHLGLLAYVFRDFEEALIPIGFGKTKGFGQVTGKVVSVKLTFCRETNGIEHMGSLMSDVETREYYGVTEAAAIDFDGIESIQNGLSWRYQLEVKNKEIGAFFDIVAPHFNQYLQTFQ